MHRCPLLLRSLQRTFAFTGTQPSRPVTTTKTVATLTSTLPRHQRSLQQLQSRTIHTSRANFEEETVKVKENPVFFSLSASNNEGLWLTSLFIFFDLISFGRSSPSTSPRPGTQGTPTNLRSGLQKWTRPSSRSENKTRPGIMSLYSSVALPQPVPIDIILVSTRPSKPGRRPCF